MRTEKYTCDQCGKDIKLGEILRIIPDCASGIKRAELCLDCAEPIIKILKTLKGGE